MDNEFYNNTRPIGAKEMRLPSQQYLPTSDFQKLFVSAKTMRTRLAVCIKKLSEYGEFSDASPELWEIKQEYAEHLPEELRKA